MEKKSKVTRAEFKKEYQGQNGIIYYHDIEFENGDKGSYGSKRKDQVNFVVGQETPYTIEEKVSGKYTNYIIKPAKEPSFKKSDPEAEKLKQQLIIAQSCLSKSVELVIAGHLKIEQVEGATDKFIKIINELGHKHNGINYISN